MPARLLTVVETSAFSRKAEKLLTSEECDDLLLLSFDVLPGGR
jgi:hypothetical protein